MKKYLIILFIILFYSNSFGFGLGFLGNGSSTANYASNAGLLNGQPDTYYLNASNLSSGTVPDARISGAYTGFTGITNTGILTNIGTVNFSGNLIVTGNVTGNVLWSYNTLPTRNIKIYHDDTDGFVQTSSGLLKLIGFSGIIGCNQNAFSRLQLRGASSATRLEINTNETMVQSCIGVKNAVGNHLVIANSDNVAKDFDHPSNNATTLYIQGNVDPDTDNTLWIGLSHSATGAGNGNGVIETGFGGIIVSPNSHLTTIQGDITATGNLNATWVSLTDKVYAEMASSYNATATIIAAQNTYYTITANNFEVITKNATISTDNGTITVLKTGKYWIAGRVSGLSGNVNDVIHLGISINGNKPLGYYESEFTLLSASGKGGQSFGGIISLNANDTVSSQIENTTAANNVTIKFYNLSLFRILD